MNRDSLAAPELAAIDVQGVTRQSFMLRGALTAGAVYGLGAVGPFVQQALAQEGGGDVDVLNFALTLEYLEAAFYTQAVKQVSGLSGDAESLATTIRDNENEHVTALTGTIKKLGGMPVKAPGVDFGNAFGSQKSFLKLAQTFEDTGERLQRRRAADRVDRGARCGRQHRPGGGPPCGRHPDPERSARHRQRLRPGARDAEGARRRQAVRQVLTKERKNHVARNRTHGADRRARDRAGGLRTEAAAGPR